MWQKCRYALAWACSQELRDSLSVGNVDNLLKIPLLALCALRNPPAPGRGPQTLKIFGSIPITQRHDRCRALPRVALCLSTASHANTTSRRFGARKSMLVASLRAPRGNRRPFQHPGCHTRKPARCRDGAASRRKSVCITHLSHAGGPSGTSSVRRWLYLRQSRSPLPVCAVLGGG